MNYFDKIPTIVYNGHTVKNLMCRANLSDKTRATHQLFYPYTIKEFERSDLISNSYYDNPGYTWLLWMANDIIDPYFGMPLSQADFDRFIQTKYGSQSVAMRKVAFYRNNWDGNPNEISTDVYAALAPAFKKYYDPVVNGDFTPIAYKRKKDDTTVATNKIVALTLSGVSGTFAVDEEVHINSSNYGFVVSADATSVTLHHLTGSFAPASSISGVESGATATVVSATTILQTIAATEPTYWAAISYYDYEHELNNQKKEIVLLDARYKGQAENELKRTLGA